jgi:hypothetical protein
MPQHLPRAIEHNRSGNRGHESATLRRFEQSYCPEQPQQYCDFVGLRRASAIISAADDFSAHPDVCAEMRTIRILGVHFAVFATPKDEVADKI